jgi:hypothetical protein
MLIRFVDLLALLARMLTSHLGLRLLTSDPIIHTGFGAEFSDPLVIAEGLAETAVHQYVVSLLSISSRSRY